MKKIFPEKCVVLDLETTGNQVRHGDQVIQIGLCVIERGEIIEQYSTLVKPTKEIPSFIEKLTGITNEDVSLSPAVEEILPDLLFRLDNAILVAHNVHFDLSFLQYILEEQGYSPFSGLILDTVELARILLPLQQGYKLHQLADDLDMEHAHPHQADSDAFATAQLFLLLMNKMTQLPLVIIQRLIPLARSLYSDIETVLRRVERNKLLQASIHGLEEAKWTIHRQLALKNKHRADPTPPFFMPYMSIDEDLNSLPLHDIISAVMPDYENRVGQQQLANLIYEAFQTEQHGLFEVGTGTGKTLAYLISSLYWAKQREEKVIISTYTIPLQEQIVEKEIPKLQAALPFSFSVAILKGRNNYLCLRKFEQSLYANEEKNYDFLLTRMQILVWLTETETGDVEELNLPSGGREYWQQVQSDSSSCLQHRCPWYKHCFYYRAKKKAQEADVVVTNHALLLADLQVDHQILPAYNYLVIDEAHHLEYMATEQYGQSVKYTSIHFLLQRMMITDRPNLTQQLFEVLLIVSNGDSLSRRVEEMAFQMGQMKMEVDQLFTSIVAFAEKKEKGYVEGNVRLVRIEHQKEKGNVWLSILQLLEKIQTEFNELKKNHESFLEGLETITEELSYSQRSIITDWNGAIYLLGEYITTIYKIVFIADTKQHVNWIEYEQKGAKNSATLKQRPLQVTSLLSETLFNDKSSVILTSATLQVNHSFDYIKEQLGLPEERVLSRTIASPFHYEQQATLLIPNYVAKIGDVNEQMMVKELAQEIVDMSILTQGRMMVLFTSYQLLKLTYHELKEALSLEGIFLFAQGIDSSSRGKLTKNFQSQEKAILLGTSSFWEGIDIPGDDLSCLVIVKLPFTPPYTPFYEAKAEQLKEQGKNAFMEYALPQAVIRFKQGFGRLIRRETDKGVIVVFDRRIIEAKYGKIFFNSLPPIEIQSVNKETLRHELHKWLG